MPTMTAPASDGRAPSRGERLMIYVEAPAPFPLSSQRSLFLAGGITGCPDWQQEMITLLISTDLMVLNPRRQQFPIHDPSAAQAQITWEYRAFRAVDAISFWFPCETLCPIVLYELGAWAMQAKPIFVGCHPDYKRRQDVEIQLSLERPSLQVVGTVTDLSQQVINWRHGQSRP